MKPEPLKDKRKFARQLNKHKEYSCVHPAYFEEDIKSAVEWYLDEVNKDVFPSENKLYDEWCKSDSKLNYLVWLVLKAFPDLNPKKGNLIIDKRESKKDSPNSKYP